MWVPTASLLVEWNLKKSRSWLSFECDDIAYKFASQLNQKAQSWKTQTPGYVRSTEKVASWILDSTGTRCNEISDSFIWLTKLKHHFSFHACLLHLISSSTSFFSISCAVTFSEWEWKSHSENQQLKQLKSTISWCVTNRRAEDVQHVQHLTIKEQYLASICPAPASPVAGCTSVSPSCCKNC